MTRTRSRAGLLVAAVVFATLAAVLASFNGLEPLALAQLFTTLGAAIALALYLVVGERRRHEIVEETLTEQASFLESLVESMGAIAATLDEDQVLEQARREAEHLFDARATILPPSDVSAHAQTGKTIMIPLVARDTEIAVLKLDRDRPFERGDTVRARVLADFAARAVENARLLAEAETREADHARLSEQLITAEQDERRRLADELHDGAVQSMSGIALMLDAARSSLREGKIEDAEPVLVSALERHRQTIRALRDLSFVLEPVVLRDQGFTPAVRALTEGLALANKIQIDVEVEDGERLEEKAQAALYQIIREAVNQAIRRGPPTRILVRVERTEDGFETVIADDAPGERRRASFESIAERTRTLNGQFRVEGGDGGGTTVHVLLPTYAARR